MNYAHLQEIKYIVDRDLDNDSFGLQDLATLISVNPHLHAVLIEYVSLDSEATAAEYDRFVDFLDGRPAITSIYLEAHRALNPAEKWRSL
ncbi:hypothetical protein MVEG_07090 [Podila verticillata NRRL 6337]|nr:hypothetical protein MVEG_07090 [Podila verticillata NRRL 6337]